MRHGQMEINMPSLWSIHVRNFAIATMVMAWVFLFMIGDSPFWTFMHSITACQG